MVKKLFIPMAASAILLAGCSTGGDLDKIQSEVEALKKDVAELQAQVGISASSSETAEQSDASKGSNSAGKGYYALGESFEFEGVTYTVTEGERKKQLGENIEAGEGSEFITYNIAIHNTSNEDYQYSQADFSIVTGAGEIEDNYIFLDMKDQYEDLGTGELASSGKRSGWVAFKVTEGDQPTELRFEKRSFQESISFKVKL